MTQKIKDCFFLKFLYKIDARVTFSKSMLHEVKYLSTFALFILSASLQVLSYG